MTLSTNNQTWWESLRHQGLLLGPSEVQSVERDYPVAPLDAYLADQLRRDITRIESGDLAPSEFVSRCLLTVFGFKARETGIWYRGNHIPGEYSHILATGESLKPNHLWIGSYGGRLPVFLDNSRRVGIGRGRKLLSEVIQWLRRDKCPLALVTNTRQWRLIHAGLDFDAQAESDRDLWFEEGEVGAQLTGLRQLLQPALLEPLPANREPLNREPGPQGTRSPLEEAIAATRRGHSELSAALGERVREAVEAIVRSHGQALKDAGLEDEGEAIYRAAVRVVMRMVVVLFAESRDLLPRSTPVYHESYGLQGLAEQLNRLSTRSRSLLAHRYSAWPRILALFRLVYEGSQHEALTIPSYGGDLFAPGLDLPIRLPAAASKPRTRPAIRCWVLSTSSKPPASTAAATSCRTTSAIRCSIFSPAPACGFARDGALRPRLCPLISKTSLPSTSVSSTKACSTTNCAPLPATTPLSSWRSATNRRSRSPGSKKWKQSRSKACSKSSKTPAATMEKTKALMRREPGTMQCRKPRKRKRRVTKTWASIPASRLMTTRIPMRTPRRTRYPANRPSTPTTRPSPSAIRFETAPADGPARPANSAV